MNKLKVTQVRSVIKRNETQKRTIQALGLGKINRSRVHNDTPAIRGMINKVRHLLEVEEVVPEQTAPKAAKVVEEQTKKKETVGKSVEPEVTEAKEETDTTEKNDN